MNNSFIPKLGLDAGSNPFRTNFSAHINNMPSMGMGNLQGVSGLQGVQGSSFKDVLNNTVNSVNDTLKAPDALMQESMTSGTVDVHDVMIANAKAELVVNVAAQMTTKVIQAYDRILQIQI